MKEVRDISVVGSSAGLLDELRKALPASYRPIRVARVSEHRRGLVFLDLDSTPIGDLSDLTARALVLAVTSRSDPDTVMRAISAGAYDVLFRPFAEGALGGMLEELGGLVAELRSTIELHPPHAAPTCVIVGNSPSLIDICKRLARLSQVEVPVLITGETGTGKELIAESIAQFSKRFGRPFVVINCAAMPENLLESELFGFEKGSFTGATAAKAGLLSIADTGTVFLDEVGELSPALQSKLLRFLQTQTFYPIGGTREVQVDVRVLSATNRNLQAMVREGRFREDLYHRLRVAELHIPPLRERKIDILPLVEFFVDRYRHSAQRPVRGVTKAFLKRLTAHDWPGNIRELENTVRSAIAVARTNYLSTRELGDLGGRPATPRDAPFEQTLSEILIPKIRMLMENGETGLYEKLHAELDKPLLEYVMSQVRENRSEAARVLGINRLTLRKKLGYGSKRAGGQK